MLTKIEAETSLRNLMILIPKIKNIEDVIEFGVDAAFKTSQIHIGDKIEDLAELFNCKIKVKKRDYGEYAYEKTFTYRGVRVFQLEKAQ